METNDLDWFRIYGRPRSLILRSYRHHSTVEKTPVLRKKTKAKQSHLHCHLSWTRKRLVESWAWLGFNWIKDIKWCDGYGQGGGSPREMTKCTALQGWTTVAQWHKMLANAACNPRIGLRNVVYTSLRMCKKNASVCPYVNMHAECPYTRTWIWVALWMCLEILSSTYLYMCVCIYKCNIYIYT
jgi:hypothetical protein